MDNYITTEGGYTFYVRDTPGEQGTIVAVHGLTGNHKQFYHFQKSLAGKYRFISYDIRGRGKSDSASSETSIFTHAEDLVKLIETLNIKRPILMGYSMGAYICALVASRLSQIEALILLDGAGEADEITEQLVLPSLKRLEKIYLSVGAYVAEIKQLYTSLNINWDDILEGNVKYEIKPVNGGWKHKSNPRLIKQDFETFYKFSPEAVCHKISCKTLLLIATGKIAGKAALFQEAGYEKTKELIPYLTTEYTDVNHYELVFNEQPEIVGQITLFLAAKGVK